MPENPVSDNASSTAAATPAATASAASPAASSPAMNPNDASTEHMRQLADAADRVAADKLAKLGLNAKGELSGGGNQDGNNSAITLDSRGSSRRTSVSTHHDQGLSDAVPIVAIVFVFLYLIVRAIMAPFCKRNNRRGEAVISGGFSPEEVALMHKMQRTLGQMETRVEALETILIERRSSGASSIAASRRPAAHSQNPDPAATHDL